MDQTTTEIDVAAGVFARQSSGSRGLTPEERHALAEDALDLSNGSLAPEDARRLDDRGLCAMIVRGVVREARNAGRRRRPPLS